MKSPSSTFNSSPIEFSPKSLPAPGKIALKFLNKISLGSLKLTVPEGQCLTFGNPADTRPEAHHANIKLNNWSICSAVLKSGDIGLAEGYMDSDWSSDNLTELLMLFIANRTQLETVVYGTRLGQLSYRIQHWFNRNTKAQARKNIHAHYDLGNAFYQLWLDSTMTYSSALFGSDKTQPLAQAQNAKYQRALLELKLAPNSTILEIGSGWGGLAEVAVKKGHDVTGITLSTEQLEWAQLRLAQLAQSGSSDGLGKAQFLLQDYRDTAGQFDGVVSIEMFEAVGEKYWDSYFECLHKNLKPGGRACVQSITIADELFERYRTSTDFIQQYIFPGGMLPSRSRFESLAVKHGFTVTNAFSFGLDYAHTLKLWRECFMQRLDAVKSVGFDDRFNRTWEFYLAYCEAAFSKHNTDVYQFTIQKQ